MDDPDKQKLDRKLASSEEGYEVRQFAESTIWNGRGCGNHQAAGPSRRTLDSFMAQRGTR